MRERLHEIQGAMQRYFQNNKLEDAGAPLVGAYYDTVEAFKKIEFPPVVGIFKLKKGTSAEFFKKNWEHIVVPASKQTIMLRGELPTSYLEMHDNVLYLRVVGYREGLEAAMLKILTDLKKPETVSRNLKDESQELPISGDKETALDELFEHYK